MKPPLRLWKTARSCLSNAVLSSMDLHAAYGGVVPEIAARSHIESIIPVIKQALDDAFPGCHPGKQWEQIDGIAVTYGAGLGGSLLVGVMTARTLAITEKKPLYAINHVEGHIYANFPHRMRPFPIYQLPTTNYCPNISYAGANCQWRPLPDRDLA